MCYLYSIVINQKTKNMITIKELELKKIYRIEWLQYITGVDLSNHCKKSFLGLSDARFRGFTRRYQDVELNGGFKYYYFCAVDVNFVWRNNIHIAFVEDENSEIIIDNEFCKCHIINARQIMITDKHIDWSLPQSQDKYFSTCRNWQFASMIKNDFEQQLSLF